MGDSYPPNDTTGNSHAAIFVGYIKDSAGKIIGIEVMDQWKIPAVHNAKIRPLTNFSGVANNPDAFYVINARGTAATGRTLASPPPRR